ncbi:hypothetical protein LINGRAPRIM_LOCUS3251 [Linum grandiflorum]
MLRFLGIRLVDAEFSFLLRFLGIRLVDAEFNFLLTVGVSRHRTCLGWKLSLAV